jgi:hypothetical protein
VEEAYAMKQERHSEQATFEVSEAKFQETLAPLQTPSDTRDIWVSLTSVVASLTATGSSVQLGEHTISLLPRRTAHDHLHHTGIIFFLPEKALPTYERRYDGAGNVRLSAEYRVRMLGSDRDDIVQLVIATAEELLIVAASESRKQ